MKLKTLITTLAAAVGLTTAATAASVGDALTFENTSNIGQSGYSVNGGSFGPFVLNVPASSDLPKGSVLSVQSITIAQRSGYSDNKAVLAIGSASDASKGSTGLTKVSNFGGSYTGLKYSYNNIQITVGTSYNLYNLNQAGGGATGNKIQVATITPDDTHNVVNINSSWAAIYEVKATVVSIPVSHTATVTSDTKWSEIEWSPAISEPAGANLTLTVENNATITLDGEYSYSSLTVNGATTFDVPDAMYEDGCFKKDLLKLDTLTAEDAAVASLKSGFVGAFEKTSTGITLRAQNMNVISINFANGQSVSGTGYTGLAPVQGNTWMNMTTTWGSGGKTVDLGTIKATADGATTEDVTDATGSCYAANTYGWNSATDVFLKGYLDDGGNHAQVTVTGIPYTKYDVIVYCATDNGSKSFRAVTVNDVVYTYDSENPDTAKSGSDNWGASQTLTAVYGTNAIRVRNQTASTLAIVGGSNGDGARGCIAAVQIVETSRETPINFTATVSGDDAISTTTWTPEKTREFLDIDTIAVTNTAANATYTFDEDVTVAKFSVVSEAGNDLTLAKGDVTLTIPSYDFSGAAGKTTVNFATGSSSVKAGSDTVVQAGGTGTLSIGDNMTATVMEGVWGGSYDKAGTSTLRFAGTTQIASVPFTSGSSGTVIYAAPFADAGDDGVQFAGALTRKFEDGFSVSGGRFVLGNNAGITQNFTQDGGAITVTGSTGPGDTFASTLFAHWNSTVNYTMNGGTFTAENAAVRFGWDGKIYYTMNDGTFRTKGIHSGSSRDNSASFTMNGGTLELGDYGLQAVGSNAAYTFAGGTIRAYADTSIAISHADGMNVTGAVTLDVPSDFAMSIGATVKGAGSITKTGAGTLTLSGAASYEGGTTVSGGKLVVTTANGSYAVGAGAAFECSQDISSGGEFAAPTFTAADGTITITATLNKDDILGGTTIAVATLGDGVSADNITVKIINADSGNEVEVTKEVDESTVYATPNAAARDLVFTPTEATNLTWNASTQFGEEQFRDYDNVTFNTAEGEAVEVNVNVPSKIAAGDILVGADYTFTGEPIIAGDVSTLDNADVTFGNDLVADNVNVTTEGSTFKAKEIVASAVTVEGATFESAVVGPSMKYVRLTITETSGSGEQPAVGEFRLYRGSKTTGYTTVDWPVGTKISDCTGLVATKTTDAYPGEVGAGLGGKDGNEKQPGCLIDGFYGADYSTPTYGGGSYKTPAYNKWWPTSVASNWTVTIEFPYPVATFSGCNFCLSDHEPRNPTAWTIEVSSDGQEWTEVNNTSNATWTAQYEWAGEGENVPAFLNKGTEPTEVSVGNGSTIVADGNWTADLTVDGAVTFKGIAGKKLTLDAASTSTFNDGATLTFDLTDYDVTAAGKQYVIAGPTEGWPDVGYIKVIPDTFDLEKDEEGYYVIAKSGNYWIGTDEGAGVWDFKTTKAWGEDAESTEACIWLKDAAANFLRNGTVTVDTTKGTLDPTALNFGGEEGLAVTFTGEVEALAGVPLAISVTNATITIDNDADMTLGTVTSAADATNTIVKTGAGTLTLPSSVDFAGGALNVNAGTVTLSANNSLKNAATVTVAGTLELDGVHIVRGYTLELGGSLVNNGAAVVSDWAQMNALTLNGNATVGGTGDFGILGSQWGDTTLTLNGNTLVKTGTNSFWLCNTAVTDGTIDLQEGIIDTNSGDTTIPGTLNLASDTEFRAKGTPSVGTVTGTGTLSGAITVTNKLAGTVNTTATITFADNATFDATGCTYTEDQKILTWSAKPTNLTITGYEGALTLVQLSDGLYAVDGTKYGDHTWTPTEATGTWTSTGFNGDNNYRDPSASAKFVDGDGVSAATITIDGTRTVTSFVIDNTNTEYVLEGGNFISTTFEKKGTGTATLKVGADTKPGAATITAGTLVIGTDASNNSYKFQADSIVVKDGAVLNLASRDAAFEVTTMTVEAGGKITSAAFNTLNAVTLTGGTIESAGGWNATWGPWCLEESLTATGNTTSYITTAENAGDNYGLQLATGIFNVEEGSTLVVSTPLKNGPGDRGSLRNQVRKTGTGTMIVKTTPTYTGETVISNGTYVLDCEINSGTYKVAEGAVLEMKTNRGLTVSGEGTVKVVLTDDDLSSGDTIVAFTVPAEATEPTVTVLNEKGDDITDDCEITGGSIQPKYVAKAGTTYYLTLQEALNVGGDVTVLADVTESVSVAADKTVTLDLNGKTLQNDKAYYTIDNAGTLTIVDNAETKGTITHLTADTSSTIRNLGTLTISDITVGGTYIGIKNDEGAGCNGGKGYGELTLNGVTFNGDDQAVQNWGYATINGGTFNGAVFTWAYAGNEGNVAGVTTIDGGTFSNKVAAVQMYDSTLGWPSSKATVTINGGTFEEKVYGTYTTDYTGEDPEKGVISVPTDSSAQFKVDETPYVTLEEGYKFKQNLAGYYQVAAIEYATLTITQVENCTIVVSNVTAAVESGAKFDVDDAVELTVYRTPAEGYELDGYEATETITMTEDQTVTAAVKESAGGKTVAPGGSPLQVEAESAEAATNGVTIVAKSPDTSIVSDADYAAYFYAKAAETSAGHYTVYAALKPEIKAAEDETAQIAAELGDIAAGTATEVAVSGAKPGLWYSVKYTDDVTGIVDAAEGDRAQAGADGSVTIATPKTDENASAQFYRVQVNTADKGTVQ